MRGDQSAAVELDPALLADDAELHREPEEPPHALQRVLVVHDARASSAVLLQEVRKDRVRVHRHVAEHVMEDVRLWGVLHGLAVAQPGRGRKLPRREHLEEGIRRQKSADWGGIPACERPEAAIYLGKIRNRVLAQADLHEAIQILLAGMLAKLRHAAAYQLLPHGMLLGGIRAPVLLDEVWLSDGQGRGHIGAPDETL